MMTICDPYGVHSLRCRAFSRRPVASNSVPARLPVSPPSAVCCRVSRRSRSPCCWQARGIREIPIPIALRTQIVLSAVKSWMSDGL